MIYLRMLFMKSYRYTLYIYNEENYIQISFMFDCRLHIKCLIVTKLCNEEGRKKKLLIVSYREKEETSGSMFLHIYARIRPVCISRIW